MAFVRDFAVVFVTIFLCCGTFVDASKTLRSKRELRFPKGGTLVVAASLASFLPKGLTEGLAHVLEFDLGFPFPERFAIDVFDPSRTSLGSMQNTHGSKITQMSNKKSSKGSRMKRNLKTRQREILFLTMENIMTRLGFKGSNCVSRFRCDLRRISPRNSLLEEMLISIFGTESNLETNNCKEHNELCPLSLLNIILHSERKS